MTVFRSVASGRFVVAYSIAALCLAASAQAQTYRLCVDEPFDSPRFPLFGFEAVTETNRNSTCGEPVSWGTGRDWCAQARANADADGSDAVRVVARNNRSQFAFGWWKTASNPCWRTVQMGDVVWLKFRIKFDRYYSWTHTQNLKLLKMGSGSGSRILVNVDQPNFNPAACYGNANPNGTSFCNYDGTARACSSDSDCIRNGVRYQCVPATWRDGAPNAGRGAIRVNNDIGLPCAGPAPLNGLIADTWYWIQVAIKSSNTNQGYMKIWVSSSDENKPDVCIGSRADCPSGGDLGINTGIEYWANLSVGHYWTDPVPFDMGYLLGHIRQEVNGTFDPTWRPQTGLISAPVNVVVK